jgi:tetratricopeptide (TPR) repeat protein
MAGGGGERGWEEEYLARGWLVSRPTSWGAGVAFASPAVGAALAGTLAPETAARARNALGELLGELSREPAARWSAYQMLAGGSEGVPVLLDLAERAAGAGGPAPASDDELLAALIRELVAHRERGGDPETELKLLLALLPLALRTAHLEGLAGELRHAMHLALEHGGGGPERLLALARLKADLDRREGRLAKAEETLRKALETSHHVDERGKAALLLQLGRVLIARQRLDEAEKLFGQVLERVGRPGTEDLAAGCRFYLGNIALHRCRYEEALAHHQAALELRSASRGPVKPRIASLTALGAAHLALGRYGEALAHYREAEERSRQAGDDEELSYVLLGIGRALSRLGDFAAASAPMRQALALREASGDGLGEAVARLAVAENHLALDRPREALREAREAHFQLSMLTEGKPLGQAEQLLGRVQLTRRKPEEARNYLRRALRYHDDRGDRAEAAFDRAWLLDAALADGRPEEVAELTGALGEFLAGADYPELGERLDYRMYRGLEWLRARGEDAGDPLLHLGRAYRGLLAKAERLRPDQRQVFLYQIPDHEAIVVAATRAGLAR